MNRPQWLQECRTGATRTLSRVTYRAVAPFSSGRRSRTGERPGLGFWLLLPDAGHCARDRPALSDRRARAPILFLWESWYPRIWLSLHDATRLVSAELQPRIAAITERAGIPAPALYRIGGPNALHERARLPLGAPADDRTGERAPRVLEPDEAAAIYAHELAHIEHFSPRVVRRLQAVTPLLIVLAVGLPFLVTWLIPAQSQRRSVERWHKTVALL